MEKKVTLLEGKTSYNMLISLEAERKIRWWCNKMPTLEWSGIMFYTYSGSFENGDYNVEVKDFVVMNLGSGTFTSFEENPDVISYMMENDLLDCQMGLIHSHNQMAAFFSGTDLDTLGKEGSDRNHFVSLIVNNAGTYVASVTIQVTSKIKGTMIRSYSSYNGETKELPEKEYESETSFIEYHKFDIKVEKDGNDLSKEELRYQELHKQAEMKKPIIQQPSLFSEYTHLNNYKSPSEEPSFEIPSINEICKKILNNILAGEFGSLGLIKPSDFSTKFYNRLCSCYSEEAVKELIESSFENVLFFYVNEEMMDYQETLNTLLEELKEYDDSKVKDIIMADIKLLKHDTTKYLN